MTNQTKIGRLTKRETEVLFCIADGLSTKQIADKLFVSKNTVANHRRNMLKKSGAKSSSELLNIFNKQIFEIKNSH